MSIIKYIINNGNPPFYVNIFPEVSLPNYHLTTGNFEFNSIPDGNYIITVTDNNSCQDFIEVEVNCITTTTTTVDPESLAFITEWDLDENEFILPLGSDGIFNMIVDWGDGSSISTVTSYDDINATHIYENIGIYQIKIYGKCGSWDLAWNYYSSNIISVIQWGEVDFNKLSFEGANNLEYIPYSSITGVENLSNFYATFSDTSSLAIQLHPDLFKNAINVSVNAFNLTFNDSAIIGSIPEELFKYNVLASNAAFSGTFWTCIGITGSIPENLFRYNVLAGEDAFGYTFAGSNVTGSIPENLFRYNTNVSGNCFQGTFSGCNDLTGSIPANLFKYNVNINGQAFNSTFRGCSMLSGFIPEELFMFNTGITGAAFQQTFNGCSNLSGQIPVNLFRYNTLIGNNAFSETFYNCYNLTGPIPEDLFRYNTNISGFSFNRTFYNCYGLNGSIPVNLFKYNTLVGNSGFNSTFYGCYNLTGSIPEDLFRYNTLVSDYAFTYTFRGCYNLTGNIPSNLFRYNILVGIGGFAGTFYGCYNIESIGEGLFKYNLNVYGNNSVPTYNGGFRLTFYGCNKLQLNKWIFCSPGEENNRFLDKNISFIDCFNRGGYTGIQGEAPELWNYNFGIGSVVYTNCYDGSGNSLTSLSNYADIPSSWK